ncbi:MAG: Ig-like domain-containing protein, partial [Saprospiraceae bacterium]
ETVYSVTGTITQMENGVSCPVADVEILVNGQFLGNKTDAEGKYALTMGEPDDYTIEPRYENHSFTPTPPTLYVDTNIENVDFEDTERFTLSGYLRADCEIYIGQSVLQIFDADNCFVKTITTNEGSGYYEVELPARPYSVQVADFTIKDGWELIDHKDEVINFFGTEEVDLTTENQTLDFVYHHPPILRIVGLPELDNCGYENPILEQNETYPLEFKVWQVEPGQAIQLGCPVLDGMVTITDLISEPDPNNPNPQEYAIVDGKVDYNLVAGNPNIIAPHLKNIAAVAKDSFTEFDRPDNVLQDVLVTGARPRDLTFATVSPEIPMMILRDPIGDGSSSFFEESSTFETALNFYTLKNREASIWSEIKAGTKFEAGLGISTETEIWGNIGSSIGVSSTSVKGTEFIMSMTTSERFSTSDNPDITGTEGDVFIGAALNLLYAIADEVNFDFETCGVETDKSLIIGTQEDAFDTRYIYTEDHIRNTLIPQLKLLESLNTGIEAERYANQILIWEQTLQRNEDLKEEATVIDNVSFSAGQSYSSATTFSTQSSSYLEFSLEINSEVSGEIGAEVGGNGSSIGSAISVRLETGGSVTTTSMQSMTTGYTLADDDQGDAFNVEIRRDPVYNTPVFKHIASTTSCPAEPGSQSRDGLQLNVNNPIVTGITPGAEGEFTLRLGNTSQSEETRTYALRFVQASNPDGAAITVGGSQYIAPIEYTIGYLGEINVLVKVAQGASTVYSYEGLTFELYPVCDENIMATTSISAFFDSPCSDVTLAEPYDDWVISQAQNNEIDIKITDYDKNDLTAINLQYSLVGLNSWTTGMVLLPSDLSSSASGTTVTWNVGNSSLPDGAYQIRLQLICGLNSVYSERSVGTIDRKAPEMIGVPEPVDDTYDNDSEIAAYFSEPLNMGAGRSNNNATLRRISDDQTFAAQVQTEGDKLVVTSNAIDLTMEAGESFEVSVPNVSDEYNNSMSSAVTWNFMVAENISSSALAMELLEFKGEQLTESNLLSWNTINEELMDSYVVERSTDGRDFEQLEAILAF